jgi:hypothetical protein
VTETFLDIEGEERQSMAKVYIDRVVELGGYLWKSPLKGKQSDAAVLQDAPDDPRTDQKAFEIRRFDENPDVKNKDSLKTAYL